DGVGSVVVQPSGFVIIQPTSITTTPGASDISLQVVSSRLDPVSLLRATDQGIRGGYSVSVDIVSSSPSVGTVTSSPLVFSANQSSKTTAFHPLAPGTSSIIAQTPVGFTTPGASGQIAAVVKTGITIPPATVGKDLQVPISIALNAAPAQAVDVTITSLATNIALVSKTSTGAGAQSVTFTGVTGTTVGTVYMQGISEGTAAISATASGYSDGVGSVVVQPSGFVIIQPSAINTTTSGSNVVLTVTASRLNPATLTRSTDQAIRGGLSVSVPVVSSNTSVGTILTSPIVFNSGESTKTATFDPIGTGTSTITVQPPTGFSTPTGQNQIVATVKPRILMASATVGQDLQVPVNVTLEAVPGVPVDIVITAASGSVATLSRDPSAEGTNSVTFYGVASASVGTVYVQGRSQGSTGIIATASGYSDAISSATVTPSGFMFSRPGDFSIGFLYPDKTIEVMAYRLATGTLSLSSPQSVRGGLDLSISVTSSNELVGSLLTNPILFVANQVSNTTLFHPLAVGRTTLGIVQPSGFSTPSTLTTILGTVF
ncbi:MAG: hypothetical protein WCL39_12430, partial [Armatimonadota bacterium]